MNASVVFWLFSGGSCVARAPCVIVRRNVNPPKEEPECLSIYCDMWPVLIVALGELIEAILHSLVCAPRGRALRGAVLLLRLSRVSLESLLDEQLCQRDAEPQSSFHCFTELGTISVCHTITNSATQRTCLPKQGDPTADGRKKHICEKVACAQS